MEILPRDAVEPAEVPLGLVPEILDPVDVRAVSYERLLVVDASVLEARDVENVVSRETICKDDGIWLDPLLNDRHQRTAAGVGDDDRMDLTSALEKPEHRHLPSSPSPALTLAATAEIALIDLNFAGQQLRCFLGQARGDELPQLMEEQRRGMAVDTHYGGRDPRGRSSHKLTNEVMLNVRRKPASATCLNHMINKLFWLI